MGDWYVVGGVIVKAVWLSCHPSIGSTIDDDKDLKNVLVWLVAGGGRVGRNNRTCIIHRRELKFL